MARKMTSPTLKNTGVRSADEIRSPKETDSELALRILEGRGMCNECGDKCKGPNAQVQGRTLGVAEASSGGGVPCNAQLGR